jgi:NAD(P)-dependent dehydrogenase (short-subunit alcohol dehydrogenase family)
MRNPAQSPELPDTAARENLPITITALDVDSDQSVATAFAAIYDSHGPIDVLVNNAGVERVGSIEEIHFDDFRAAMETNYFGALRCIKAVVPAMRQRRSGCIINVTSVAGRIASPPLAPYTASKWALEALSEALAAEMKTFNVRVAIVEPGIIDTAMARRISEPTNQSAYTQRDRMAAVFTASLQTPTSPTLVAEKILEIAANESWQLRHLVGPNAVPLIDWRRGMTDEEWVDLHSSDNETYYRRVEKSAAPGGDVLD